MCRMGITGIEQLVEGTGDAAFAVDSAGIIVAWNQPCASLFGIPAAEALGQPCGRLLEGVDECGPVCKSDCCVLRTVRHRSPVSNFDMQVETEAGRRWCNVSLLQGGDRDAGTWWSIHVLRVVDVRKRLEVLLRDFVATSTELPHTEISRLLSSTRSPRKVELTRQELVVLRRLARGTSTTAIAEALGISEATVNNHVQHLMRKMDAHTRLEAIRRAELTGLL